jgi:hypothetical protein
MKRIKNLSPRINKEDNNGYIFTNFVRSFDQYHNSNNRMRLISSVMFIPKAILTGGCFEYFQNYYDVSPPPLLLKERSLWDGRSSDRAYSDKINNIVFVKEDSVINGGKNYMLVNGRKM